MIIGILSEKAKENAKIIQILTSEHNYIKERVNHNSHSVVLKGLDFLLRTYDENINKGNEFKFFTFGLIDLESFTNLEMFSEHYESNKTAIATRRRGIKKVFSNNYILYNINSEEEIQWIKNEDGSILKLKQDESKPHKEHLDFTDSIVYNNELIQLMKIKTYLYNLFND